VEQPVQALLRHGDREDLLRRRIEDTQASLVVEVQRGLRERNLVADDSVDLRPIDEETEVVLARVDGGQRAGCPKTGRKTQHPRTWPHGALRACETEPSTSTAAGPPRLRFNGVGSKTSALKPGRGAWVSSTQRGEKEES